MLFCDGWVYCASHGRFWIPEKKSDPCCMKTCVLLKRIFFLYMSLITVFLLPNGGCHSYEFEAWMVEISKRENFLLRGTAMRKNLHTPLGWNIPPKGPEINVGGCDEGHRFVFLHPVFHRRTVSLWKTPAPTLPMRSTVCNACLLLYHTHL